MQRKRDICLSSDAIQQATVLKVMFLCKAVSHMADKIEALLFLFFIDILVS